MFRKNKNKVKQALNFCTQKRRSRRLLVTLTFQGHQRSTISIFFGKVHMRLHNGLLLIRILYLIPFVRYSTSKISVSDLDLSAPTKVKYFKFTGKLICDFKLKRRENEDDGVIISACLSKSRVEDPKVTKFRRRSQTPCKALRYRGRS